MKENPKLCINRSLSSDRRGGTELELDSKVTLRTNPLLNIQLKPYKYTSKLRLFLLIGKILIRLVRFI